MKFIGHNISDKTRNSTSGWLIHKEAQLHSMNYYIGILKLN